MAEDFYQQLSEKRKSENKPILDKLKGCIYETLDELSKKETTDKNPGMFLGKVQSGKTSAYLGVIALSFDKGYDIAIILQKGTKALSEQTIQRVNNDYEKFIENDKMKVFDIMKFPNNLTKWVLNQKMVIVAKKQKDNLQRVMGVLSSTYPNLKTKKILIIDDEADFASICFRKNSQEDKIEQGKISFQIDEIRRNVAESDYLQVTATPYSLYLQPDETENGDGLFLPKRPMFTVMVPEFPGYIGGDYYFLESDDEESVAHFIFNEISADERNALKKEDGRVFRIEEALYSPKIRMIRNAIVNFIVGSCIRRIQQKKVNERQKKYSFVIHTEQTKLSHDWQVKIVDKIRSELVRILNNDMVYLDNLIGESYLGLVKSIKLRDNLMVPDLSEVKDEVKKSLRDDYLAITKVNSDKEVNEILDIKTGQLKLLNPLNIFVGGQILDRGITVDNLVGFYYGRNPKKPQQDTVLQHSRMYGDRPEDDLSVTRFYTTLEIYQTMKKINEFDNDLRKFLENNQDVEQQGIYFIRKDDQNRLIPCSPNKTSLSNITMLKPFKRLLPVGFQTDFKTNIKQHTDEIDKIISNFQITEEPCLVNLDDAERIIKLISKILKFEKGYEWDIKAFLGSMEYLSKNTTKENQRGKVLLLIRKDRNLSRFKEDGRFSDAPDTPKTEGLIARESAIDIPMLMLFRQNGAEDRGWRGSPFWWPVLYVPKNIKTVIFASEIKE